MSIKIIKEMSSVADFKAWLGGKDTIIACAEKGMTEELTDLCNEAFPSGCTEEELNNFLCRESSYIGRQLGIPELYV